MCRVSVIIPTYNRAAMIGDAIDSVLAQEGIAFEVIVVDGGRDGTREVVAAYADPRLRYVAQGRPDVAQARNTGIRHARGGYIAFLDSDDAFLPGKLAFQADYLDAHPETGMLYAAYRRQIAGRPDDEIVPPHTERDALAAFLLGCRVATPTVMVRRGVLDGVGGFDESLGIGEDLDLWTRIAQRYQVEATPEPLAWVRVHAGGIARDPDRIVRNRRHTLDKVRADLSWRLRRRVEAHIQRQGALLSIQQGQPGKSVGYALRALAWWP